MGYLRKVYTKIFRTIRSYTKVTRPSEFFELTNTRITKDYTVGAFALADFDVSGVGNDITISWTPRAEFDNYRVYRSADNVNFTMIVELAAGSSSYLDAGLTQGTYYYYAVGVLPSGVESLKTDVLSVFANEAPADPAGLAVIAENGQAVLSWDAVADSNLQDYLVYLDGVQVDTTTLLEYTFTGLTNGQQYTFGVQARDDLGLTSNISTIIATVQDTVAPVTPTGLLVTGADQVADLSWNANTEPDLAGYNVYVDGVKDNGTLITGTTYQVTGLTNNTTVGFQVSAVDGDGNESALSDVVSDFVEDTVAPAAPTGFVVNDLNGTADLSWDVSGAGDFKQSNVYLDGVLQGSTTTTTFQITGLTVGQQYTYEVSHVDTSDNESTKAQVVSTMADDVAPNAPTGLQVVGADNVADLTWTANTEGDLAGYNVYVNGVQDNGALITTTSYQVTGLTNGVTYDFQVSAVDDFGNESPLSAIVSDLIEDTQAPATPTGLAVTSGDTVLNCSWDANSEPDLAGYNIYVNGVKNNASIITGTTYQVTGLTNGTVYDIQVSAVDNSGNESALSAIVQGTPVAAPTAGGGLSFDAQYAKAGLLPGVGTALANDFTLEVAILTDTTQNRVDILGVVNSGTSLRITLNSDINFGGLADAWVFEMRDSDGVVHKIGQTGIKLDDADRHMLTIKKESGSLSMYVDGVKQTTNITEVNNNPSNFNDFIEELHLNGKNENSADNNTGFASRLALGEFRIWNTARTDQQILDNHYSLLSDTNGLLYYNTFVKDDAEPTKLKPIIGNDGDLNTAEFAFALDMSQQSLDKNLPYVAVGFQSGEMFVQDVSKEVHNRITLQDFGSSDVRVTAWSENYLVCGNSNRIDVLNADSGMTTFKNNLTVSINSLEEGIMVTDTIVALINEAGDFILYDIINEVNVDAIGLASELTGTGSGLEHISIGASGKILLSGDNKAFVYSFDGNSLTQMLNITMPDIERGFKCDIDENDNIYIGDVNQGNQTLLVSYDSAGNFRYKINGSVNASDVKNRCFFVEVLDSRVLVTYDGDGDARYFNLLDGSLAREFTFEPSGSAEGGYMPSFGRLVSVSGGKAFEYFMPQPGDIVPIDIFSTNIETAGNVNIRSAEAYPGLGKKRGAY